MGAEIMQKNRKLFLKALRSNKYEKGRYTKGQDKPPEGATGFCAVGLAYTLFCNNTGPIITGLGRALNLTKDQIGHIQNEWNDSDLTFPQIAEKIEREYFLE